MTITATATPTTTGSCLETSDLTSSKYPCNTSTPLAADILANAASNVYLKLTDPPPPSSIQSSSFFHFFSFFFISFLCIFLSFFHFFTFFFLLLARFLFLSFSFLPPDFLPFNYIFSTSFFSLSFTLSFTL